MQRENEARQNYEFIAYKKKTAHLWKIRLKKKVSSDSGDGQDDPLPLPPPLLLLVEFARGLGEEHDVLFALDLPLEELQGGAVEAHHVLRAQKWMVRVRFELLESPLEDPN